MIQLTFYEINKSTSTLISIILTSQCGLVEFLCASAPPQLSAWLSVHSQSFAASQPSQVCLFLVSSFQPKPLFAMRERKRGNDYKWYIACTCTYMHIHIHVHTKCIRSVVYAGMYMYMYAHKMYKKSCLFTFPMDEELALRLSTSSTSPLATVWRYDRAFFSSETS